MPRSESSLYLTIEKQKIDEILAADQRLQRAILQELFMDNNDTLEFAWGLFTKMNGFPMKKRNADDVDDAAMTGKEAKRAKVIDDYRCCARCNKPFQKFVNDNDDMDIPAACWYHPDRKKEDYEHADYRRRLGLNADLSSLWLRLQSSYTLKCCGTSSRDEGKGCTFGKHWATDDPRGRHPLSDTESGDVNDGASDSDVICLGVQDKVTEANGKHDVGQ